MEKANYPIAWMCSLLAVPRTSFYQWRTRAETPTELRRQRLASAFHLACSKGLLR